MRLPYPHFQVNYKLYPGTGGSDGLELAGMIERIATETDGTFVLTPQLPDVRLLARETELPVIAPAVDPVDPGRGMGKILPETLSDGGAVGAVINHAENRDTIADIQRKVERCRDAGLDAIVCVDSVEAGRAVAPFDPDQFLFERPDDIGGQASITQTHPERVKAFLDMRDANAPETAVRIGGGITSATDVSRAFDLGVDAVGAASAIATAENPGSVLRAIGAAVAEQ
ncbi:triose-phosphate isomerase [Halorhabdus sp. CUG00001]|uniref:triose-phosphate isomerase n=1 Tax=Halorhabdus sp. CUG00001 TaxID=2600297 RepID=UPI00131C106F|nr:triose-phosphate isomerase [Halorhabdus sp. CUG00001]